MKFSSIAIAALLGNVSAADIFNMENLNLASLDDLEAKADKLLEELHDAEADQEKIDNCTNEHDPHTVFDDDEKTTIFNELIECYQKIKDESKPAEKTEEEKKAEADKKAEEEKAAADKKAEEEKAAAAAKKDEKLDADISSAKKEIKASAQTLKGFKRGKCGEHKPADDAEKADQLEGWTKFKDCIAKKVKNHENQLKVLKENVAKLSENVKDADKMTEALKPLDGADEKTLKEQVDANRAAIKNLRPLQEKKGEKKEVKDGDKGKKTKVNEEDDDEGKDKDGKKAGNSAMPIVLVGAVGILACVGIGCAVKKHRESKDQE